MENNEQKMELDELLVNYITGNASGEERDSVRKWIKESVENKRYFDELKEIYKAAKTSAEKVSYSADLSWERIKSRHYREIADRLGNENRKDRRMFVMELLRYAAIALILISLGILGYRIFKEKMNLTAKEIWNTIEAPYGSRVHLTLADGSKVWLNAGSSLRYSSLFGQSNRKVFLQGEAYFDVETDSCRRFIVKTPHLDILVYGTEFNVKAYSDEDIVQTTLVRGSVTLEGDLISKLGKRSVKLKPNQTATYYIPDNNARNENLNKIARTITPGKVVIPVGDNLRIMPDINPAIYTSWKDPLWYIESETLSSLAAKFERRFNIKFIFQSTKLKDYKFTGTLKDETLEQVLSLIKLSAPIEYRVENNQVVLMENNYYKNSYDKMLVK